MRNSFTVFLFLILAAPLASAAEPRMDRIIPGETYWVSSTGTAAWADCRSDLPLDGADACALSTANSNRIYQNALFHNGHLATYSGFQGGLYFSAWSGQSPVDNVVKNNVFYDNKNGSVSYDGPVDPQIIEDNLLTVDIDLTWLMGTGVALAFDGDAPDQGINEYPTVFADGFETGNAEMWHSPGP